MTNQPRTTVWVLGDQLDPARGAMADARPDTHRILVVESDAKLASKRWHVQRAHFTLTALRRFVAGLRATGFDVDHRRTPTFRSGFEAHIAEHGPSAVVATEPNSYAARRLLADLGVSFVRSEQFLCHPDEFREWADARRSFKMEDFYRWQRRRLDYLMDGDEPAGGRWNFDADNREPPPKDGSVTWPEPMRTPLDDLDRDVLADLPTTVWGAPPDGLWATSRAEAVRRLDHVIEHVLPRFGPHEDAMLSTNWHLAHALLAQYLNVGLLHPSEVCDRVDDAYRAGLVPIASAEGFVRQVIGWREYVWNLRWYWGETYADENSLDATRPLPPVFTGRAGTEMRCVSTTLQDLHDHAWAHHIQRLMILGNLALLAGVDPREMTEWMWAGFVDGAEWVMVPNVVGMALHADGGRMATKPYAAGGAYIDRMSDYCTGCRYDRKQRTGPDACPFTTLYWDFVARHADRFGRNPRMVTQVRAAGKLSDLPAVRVRAAEVLDLLDRGEL